MGHTRGLWTAWDSWGMDGAKCFGVSILVCKEHNLVQFNLKSAPTSCIYYITYANIVGLSSALYELIEIQKMNIFLCKYKWGFIELRDDLYHSSLKTLNIIKWVYQCFEYNMSILVYDMCCSQSFLTIATPSLRFKSMYFYIVNFQFRPKSVNKKQEEQEQPSSNLGHFQITWEVKFRV